MATLAEMLVGNALQNQDVNKGPDIAGSLQKGAQIAQQQQDLDLRKQQIQMQMQQVHDAKLEKFAQAVEKGQQYAGKAQSNYYQKFLPQYRDSLGLHNDVKDDALQFMTAPETQTVFNAVRSDVLRGGMTGTQAFQLLNDPQALADYAQKNKIPLAQTEKGFQPLTQQQYDAINADEKSAETNRATMGKQQNEFAQQDKAKLQDFKTHVADRTNSELKPLLDEKVHINSAQGAINRIADAYAEGKTPSQADVTLAATGLATTVSKRINPTEFENIMHLPGAENWTIDKWNKYLAGGVNPNVVKSLASAIKATNSQVDQNIGTTKAQIEAEVVNSRWRANQDEALAPMRAALGAIPQPAPRKKKGMEPIKPPPNGTISAGKYQLTPQQARDFIAQHPDDPMTAGIKKQLGE